MREKEQLPPVTANPGRQRSVRTADLEEEVLSQSEPTP